jgi:hypothetical protein
MVQAMNWDLWPIGFGMIAIAIAWYKCTKLRYDVHMKRIELEQEGWRGKDS